ncbi:HERP1 protein, partial [Psilopogon haemacephalus]|nr:HERP1 protein [Psilopogon haemacephalus]
QQPCPALSPACSAYTTYSLLQMSWLQQLYARQYYLQYLATAAGPAHAQRPRQVPVSPAAPLPEPFPTPAQAAAAAAAAPRGQAVPGANLRMNAQGGALMEEEEEEGARRDWLDWLYSATLFYVLLNVVYFYSNLGRFLLVTAGTVLMYLHHVGWLPFHRRPIQPFPGHAAAAAAAAPPAAGNQDQNNNLQGGDAAGAEHAEEGQAMQELQQASNSLLGTAWLFFKTFFASLLPEGPGLTRN